jgi:hypothetical protein
MLAYEPELEESFRDQVFYKLYLPEFKRVIQHYWHDSSLFASYNEEFKAFEASVHRSKSQLKLSNAQAFALSCLIRTPIDKLGKRFRLFGRLFLLQSHLRIWSPILWMKLTSAFDFQWISIFSQVRNPRTAP